MRLYAVALIIWTAIITASSESNVANLSDEKVVDYTEKQITRFYVTDEEARSFEQTDTEDHPDVDSSESLIRADERGSNGISASDVSTPEAIYATPLAETIDDYSFKERSRKFGYIAPEEILLVQNAGSFGQRVRQDHSNDRNTFRPVGDKSRKDDGYASIRKPFGSTMSPLEDEDSRAYMSVTSEPYLFALKKGSDSTYNPPSSKDSDKSKMSNSEEIFNVETTTEVSSAPLEIDITSIVDENDVVPENLQTLRARSFRAYNDTADKMTERPTESVEKNIVRVSSSTSVEISPSLQPVKFSGPIVVPDLIEKETPEMIIDYLDDSDAGAFRSIEDSEKITPENYAAGSRPTTSNDIQTSSIVLNPLQVGIALMNADEIDSIDDNEQSAATDTKDYLQDYPQDDLQRLSAVDKKFVESDVENRSRIDYKNESFQSKGEGEKSSVGAVTQKVSDNSVEIQKSVEIYHTAPVHEIHYPPVYIQQTSNLGVIDTNNIGRSNLPYGQDEQSESRSNYDIYRGTEQSVIKASEQKFTGSNQYNALEDDLGKSTTSTLVAEYPSIIREQSPIEAAVELQPYKYNDVRPILLVPNQFDDTSYDQSSNVRHSFKDDGSASSQATKVLTYVGTTKQESATETYRSEQQQPQQSNQQPIIDHQFRTDVRRPEVPQLVLKIIPDGSSANGGFVVPIPQPYPTVEKTVHVPIHPIEVDKVVERKVPFPVERVVEKRVQVQVPQLYHMHAPVVEKQIRVPHVYPIHVERLIEKRMPYTVQRLLVQPVSPYHSSLRLPTPMEKPATLVRLPPSSRPYPTDAEKPTDSGGSIDPSKLNDVQIKYRQKSASGNPRGGDSAAFEPQIGTNISFGIPPYSRPLTYDYNIDVGKSYVPFTDVKLMILPRKYNNHVMLRPQAVASPTYTAVPFRQQIVYNLVERNKDNIYMAPAPPRKTLQNKTKSPPASVTTVPLRRSRQPETQYPGSFRQSKMEYGFKPPMVPSVQYDELTATQVEN